MIPLNTTRLSLVLTSLAAIGMAVVAKAQPNPAEQKAKAVTAVRGDGLTVDGKPTEGAWANGLWYTGFVAAGTEEIAAVQTRFAVRFDDARLYLAAVAEEPNLDKLERDQAGRDGKVFSNDCVEFMVDPTSDRTEYYHFAVDANGQLYDAERRQGGHVYSAEWNSTAEAAGAVGDESFSVELAIPLVELGLTPQSAKQPWAIQVARERHAGGPLELS